MVTITHSINDNVNLKMYNSIGSLVYNQTNISNNETIDLKNIAKGVYLITLESTNEKIVKKLIVR